MGWIYVIRGPLDGTSKAYIGQTRMSPRRRWNKHTTEARYFAKHGRKKNGTCSYLYKAMTKYGIDMFNMIPMLECDDEDLDQYEDEWIKKYESLAPRGYNLKSGGNSNGKHHEITKKLISKNTSIGITKHLNKYRKHPESAGLPKYINYYVRKDRKKKTHGYNVYHSKLGKTKRVFVPIDQPLTEDMKQKAINLLKTMTDEYNKKVEGSETEC